LARGMAEVACPYTARSGNNKLIPETITCKNDQT
jgi:hypothetical protein